MIGTLVVDFEKQMNAIVAPVTNAWTDFRFERITIQPGDIQENKAMFTVVVSAVRMGTQDANRSEAD